MKGSQDLNRCQSALREICGNESCFVVLSGANLQWAHRGTNLEISAHKFNRRLWVARYTYEGAETPVPKLETSVFVILGAFVKNGWTDMWS